jgi:SAM-dependent methyltransferase
VADVRIWHHGLMARWWAEFNRGGDDIDYFRRAIVASGEPALDAGCGTGRLLLPIRASGIDIDGSDASADMLDWCRRLADEENVEVTLHRQAMHELDLPRRYRTIIVCGAFGLGGTRADDLEGLRRIRAHLEPGGSFVMDHYLPNSEMARSWSYWTERPELPRPWPARGNRRRARDGSDLDLRTRLSAMDPLEQTTTLEMRIAVLREDVEVAFETNAIAINLYFKNEIELMLTCAGFRTVRVTGFPDDRAARPWDDERIVFHATA